LQDVSGNFEGFDWNTLILAVLL